MHHNFTSTSALTTEYSGVWETLSLGVFAAANTALLGCHPLTELIFFVFNMWLSVEDHCGYDLPWATHRIVPLGLYGGAPHHSLHHLKSSCNFAPYFTHMDRLAGTLQTKEWGQKYLRDKWFLMKETLMKGDTDGDQDEGDEDEAHTNTFMKADRKCKSIFQVLKSQKQNVENILKSLFIYLFIIFIVVVVIYIYCLICYKSVLLLLLDK